MAKQGCSGSSSVKYWNSLGLPIGAMINCADNNRAKNLYIIYVKGIKGQLNRLSTAGVGDMVMITVKKGRQPELRKEAYPAVAVQQKKSYQRKNGMFLYFEDNTGVIENNEGKMEGPAIIGPVAKECADLWPRIVLNADSITCFSSVFVQKKANELLKNICSSHSQKSNWNGQLKYLLIKSGDDEDMKD
ncbi:60S ribosomal protein L23-like [Cebus imitator]|uniref:60S ribosomal protein L23-like n=1 Tax=Cebus imitator TaxID=2715852 RepID=UPI00189A8D80|nr:60S ribosomal protein L23-like [Cebus imitator]